MTAETQGLTAVSFLAKERGREAVSQRAWLVAHLEERQQGASREEAVAAFEAEAQESGHCVACWGRSTSWGLYLDRARLVRHRDPANCPTARRDRVSPS